MAVEQAMQVQRDVRIEAPPETVFEFFTDPQKMVRWMGVEADLDPQPGGRFRVKVNKYVALGEYVEVDAPSRVVFTWGWENEDMAFAPGSSTIEVTLEAEDGGTRLNFVHRDLPDETAVERHGDGWDNYLGRLEKVAAGQDPGPDRFAAQTQ